MGKTQTIWWLEIKIDALGKKRDFFLNIWFTFHKMPAFQSWNVEKNVDFLPILDRYTKLDKAMGLDLYYLFFLPPLLSVDIKIVAMRDYIEITQLVKV